MADLQPLTTAEELAAAKTSHLDGFKPPTEAADEDEPQTMEHVEIKLPRTIKDTLKALETLRGTTASGPLEQKVKGLKLQRLALHLHALEQIPTTPALTSEQHNELAGRQTDHAKAFRIELLAREHPEVRELVNAHQKCIEQIKNLIEQIKQLTKTKETENENPV